MCGFYAHISPLKSESIGVVVTLPYMVELGFRTVISPIWGSILIAGIYLFVFVMIIIGANNNPPIEPTWLSKFLKIPNF